MAVFEELGRGDAALAFSLSMHNAVAAAVAGHAELAERWARALAAGDALGGFSLTEPHAGSDATAITTRAEPDGERLARDRAQGVGVARRRGRPVPRRVQDVGRAGPPRRRNRRRRARRAGRVVPACLYRKACADFLPIGEMELDGAPGALLAPPGAGMRAALGAIDVARCDIAAIAAGPARRGARHRRCATPPSGRRSAAPLLDLEAIQFALADVATDLEASRLLYRQAAERLGTPDGPGRRRARQAVLPRRGPAGGDRLQRGARRLRLAARPPAGADDRARQDAPGGRRDGRDPARRDRPRSLASSRSPRG